MEEVKAGYREKFLDRFLKDPVNLRKNPDGLIAELVAQGEITQEEANALAKELAQIIPSPKPVIYPVDREVKDGDLPPLPDLSPVIPPEKKDVEVSFNEEFAKKQELIKAIEEEVTKLENLLEEIRRQDKSKMSASELEDNIRRLEEIGALIHEYSKLLEEKG